jgi:HK97 gp10 family phage protein
MPEDFLLELAKLAERTDEIIPKVLEAGGEVVLEKAKGNLQAVVGKNTKLPSRSTGELVRSLGLSKARQTRDGSGWNVKVGFAEPRKGTGESNAKIANILEHGKHGQPAKPFMTPARSSSRKACIDAMQAAFEKEVDIT